MSLCKDRHGEMTKFRLLKDLPDLAAGAVFKFLQAAKSYNGSVDLYSCSKDSFRNNIAMYTFTLEDIENNPEWFEEIEEKSDAEVLAEWLSRNWTFDHKYNPGSWHNLSEKLLETFDLDMDKIK